MNTRVERAARAIFATWANGCVLVPQSSRKTFEMSQFDGCAPYVKEAFYNLARAAISTMEEPTELTVKAQAILE